MKWKAICRGIIFCILHLPQPAEERGRAAGVNATEVKDGEA
jgi:hypothetical protein